MKPTPNLRRINYEGDDLKLTKEQILGICNQVENYWTKSPIKNAKRLFALNLFKGGIKITSKQDVEDLWAIMLKFVDELRYQNMLSNGSTEAEVLGMVKTSIAEEIFS